MYRAATHERKRQPDAPCIAWLRLQDGTLRVNLNTCIVYSTIHRSHTCEPFPIRIYYNGAGYPFVTLGLSINGIQYRQSEFLHRLVWMAKYKSLPPKGLDIDHKDDNPKNPHWRNLQALTRSENLAKGLRRKARKLTAEEIAAVDDFLNS